MENCFEKQFFDLYNSSEDNKEALERIIYEFDLETDENNMLLDPKDYEFVINKFKELVKEKESD